MAHSFQGDIPNGIWEKTVYLPSRASNAADSIIPLFPPGHQPVELLSAVFDPISSQAGSATHYADLKVINLGSGSTAGSVMALWSLSAAGQGVSALIPQQMTIASAAIGVASGERPAISYASQGSGIAVVAHSLHLAYRYS